MNSIIGDIGLLNSTLRCVLGDYLLFVGRVRGVSDLLRGIGGCLGKKLRGICGTIFLIVDINAVATNLDAAFINPRDN